LKILQTKGIYNEGGNIVLNSIKTMSWSDISEMTPPQLPAGTSVELSISFDENIFLSGSNGIVWATYDLRQVEIIQSALIAQHISSEINKIELGSQIFFLIKNLNDKDVNDAIDFIWRSNNGLRLKPDWAYSKGEKNKSFELWLSGH
jgi:hypothetical protein